MSVAFGILLEKEKEFDIDEVTDGLMFAYLILLLIPPTIIIITRFLKAVMTDWSDWDSLWRQRKGNPLCI